MTQRVLGPKESPRRRWTNVVALTLAICLGLFYIAGAQAVHDDGLFELDKNATNNLNTTKLGILQANISSTDNPIVVCESATAPAIPPNFTILVEAEQMTVTARSAIAGGAGGCSTKASYTVTRDGGDSAAHQKADDVTLLVQAPAKAGPDWNEVYAKVQADADSKCTELGLLECSYANDGAGATIYDGGSSKDHLPIDGWHHKSGSVSDKSNILNAYAAKDVVAGGAEDGHQILYFGADRLAVDGSTDAGFWFFKNPVVANPDGTFTGEHVGSLTTPGDILILTTFTQGGATNNVRVFRWVGSGGNESGTIQGPDGTFGDCVPGAADPNDKGCATVNDTSILVPWDHQSKGEPVGGWVPAGGLLEGAVDLTALGLDGCFSSFLAETRASPSVPAILEDFVLGDFEACGSGLSTTPGDGVAGASNSELTDTNDNDIPDISIGSGSVQVRDRAELSITGVSTWSGTMDFWLCKVDAPDLCDGTPPSIGNVGTKIGGSIPVTQATTQPILSAAATVTSAGRYCWRGVFTSGTTGVPPATDSSAGECFEVLPAQPTISTSATASVSIGGSIDDTATLGGTANKPGSPVINPTTAGGAATGTITFTAYGPHTDATTCTTVAYTSVVDVSGNGPYDASDGTGGTFTPTQAGTYNWTAVYSGDPPNTLSVSGSCGDASESSVVSPLQPAISTAATAGPVALGQSIDDTATLSGAAAGAAGTITFTAYGPHDETTTCTTVAYTSVVNVSGNGPYTASTGSGGAFTPTLPGTYNWVAVYSGDLPNTLGVSGSCGDANESSVVISLQPTIGTTQSFVPNDAATITVASGGGDLAGNVVFKMWVDDATCSGTADYTSGSIAITTGTGTGLSRTVTSGNTTSYGTTGTTFHWVVEYTSTNLAHENVTSSCGVEHSSITVQNSGTPSP